MWILILGLVVILLGVYRTLFTSFLARFPGPFSLPLVGSLPYLFHQKSHQSLKWYETEIERYGPLFRIEGLLGTKKALIVSDPEMIGHFLIKNFKNYQRWPPVKRFDQLFGKGIFNSRGVIWTNQRKTARPFFKTSTLDNHLPIIEIYIQELIDHLYVETSTSREVSLDFQDLFYMLTLKVICHIGFGVKDLSHSRCVDFNKNFNKAQEIVEKNIRDPILEYLPDSEFDTCLEEINKFLDYIIQEKQDSDGNLLSLFRNSQDVGSERDTILNFIIAGRDTTATLLTWTLFCLSLHPKVEEKLKREILNISPPYTQAKINKCKYLRCILNEVLRLYPPIPVDTRRSINSDILPKYPKKVPPGTFLVYSAWVMGRHKKYWKDHLKFWPERWEGDFKPVKHTFVPFHAGPQTCLGKNLAYFEASVVLIKLFRFYHFELDSGISVIPRKWIVLTARDGMWFKIK